VFAMGRVAGWIAHAQEQAKSGRLIRPKSRYIGPLPKKAA
jgi:citrate synthase